MSHPSAYDLVVVAALEPFESALDEIVRERRELDAAEAAWLQGRRVRAVGGLGG